MKPRGAEFLENIVLGSSSELFAAYGAVLERKSPTAMTDPSDAAEVCSGGLIAFAGSLITGSLLVVSSFQFLASCRPASLRSKTLSMSSATDWILVRDWSMELANQLLGRVRNRLYQYGISVDAKCPTAVSGHPLAVSVRARKVPPFQFATSGKQTVRIWLDATTSASFEKAVLRKPDPPPTIPKVGEVLVF